MYKLTIPALFAFAFFMRPAHAQNLELGPAAGIAYYNGDLNPGMPFQDVEPAFGLVARYSKSTRWAYRLNILSGRLATSGNYARVDTVRDIPFNTPFQEAGLVAEFNFFDYFTGSEKSYATPYLFAGLGATRIQATDATGTAWRLPLHASFGLGFKYSLTNRLAVGAEWGMRRAFADYLDHSDAIPLNETAKWDDPGKTDWYNFTGVSLTYRFSLQKKHKCDAFQNRVYKK
ncbi:MAG: hypothetical protein IPM52_04840 [Bacteroidetes bacterium]|nr:hypothetical protein [Bacteroidota bacterium]